jgi:DNA helicase HerA-like ATPase
MTKLRIASDLALPLDATTQAIGIVAKRRVGKSYTARRFAEQLLNAGQQVVIVDPKGDWWGIRSSADGKAPGFPVVILGGEHGDVPLEKGAGEIVAKMVVEERVSVPARPVAVPEARVAVFMADFLETLYRLKAKESLRTPLMLIVDEADAIAPQKPHPGEERMLGAGEDIVRRGGQRGIGCMMITQRTAVLNKNVLTQCEMLVALRTISPQDLKAMQAWIDVHGSIEERDTLMASLPSLPQGDAWFWSPGWPTADGIFKRVHVSPIETFDSGATPKSGEKRVEPKTSPTSTSARCSGRWRDDRKAKADDPKELRKRSRA